MLQITEECINCSSCVDECESDAIYNAGDEYTVEGETKEALAEDVTFIVP